MCIDLSSANVAVAEKGLDRANIGAVHKEIGGETMAKSMWGNMFSNAGGAGIFLNDAFD